MSSTLKSYQSEGSIMSTIKSSMTENSKCPSCTKSVYHVEEVICSGNTWHKDCFKCGGAGDFGCQRKLNLSDFTLHTAVPYCKGCYIKVITKPVATEQIVVGASSGSDRTDINDLNGFVKISQRRSSFGPHGKAGVIANALAVVKLACPKCSKTVFKAEEIILAGFSWHKACFTCGGASEDDGCKKTLNQTDFRPHRGNPFCKGCIGKQPILEKRKTESSILRTETELTDMSQDTTIDISGLPTTIDMSASATTTVESILTPTAAVTNEATTPKKIVTKVVTKSQNDGASTDSPSPKVPPTLSSPAVTPAAKAPVVTSTAASPTTVTAPVAVATSICAAPPAKAPIMAVASTTNETTIATVVSVDGQTKDSERAESEEGDDMEACYQDENGVPCTKDGEPLYPSDGTAAASPNRSPSGKSRPPTKTVTKIKKYFETVFRKNKKQPEALSDPSPEKQTVVELKELKEQEVIGKDVLVMDCTDEDTTMCSKDEESEDLTPPNTPKKRPGKIRSFFSGLYPYRSRTPENAVEVPAAAVLSD